MANTGCYDGAVKHQYFGDENDYRKYGLIRLLLASSSHRLAVCWMLTPDDGRSDGKFIDYLEQPGRWRDYDPPLFEVLRRAISEGDRNVAVVEREQLFPRAVYGSDLVPEDRPGREAYFDEFWRIAGEAELVFFDPDNGIEVSSVGKGRKNSSKFVYFDELDAAYERGKSLLVYQHFPRKPRKQFVQELVEDLKRRWATATVCAFWTPRVVFLLVVQPQHLTLLDGLATIEQVWAGQLDVRRF